MSRSSPRPHGFVVGSQSRHGRSALIGTAEGVQVDLPWSIAAIDLRTRADRPRRSVGRLPRAVGRRRADGPAARDGRDGPAADWSPAGSAPGPSRTTVRHRWRVRALQRIEEGAPSVGALAAELGCSRGHLHRVVRSSTGQSPSTLVRVVPTASPRRARRDAARATGPSPTRRPCWATPITRTCATRPGSSPAGRRPSSSAGTSTPPTAETPGDLTTSRAVGTGLGSAAVVPTAAASPEEHP